MILDVHKVVVVFQKYILGTTQYSTVVEYICTPVWEYSCINNVGVYFEVYKYHIVSSLLAYYLFLPQVSRDSPDMMSFGHGHTSMDVNTNIK